MYPPAKRLRGWQLEEAKQNPCQKDDLSAPHDDPCQKDSSPLVTRLLELWSEGRLSASQCTEIAHLAVLEGAKSAELMKVAKCGNFTLCKGNSHRDMMNTFMKECHLCQPHLVKVEVIDPKTEKLATAEASMLLPHSLFSSIYENYQSGFHDFFATKDCYRFWQNLEKTADPRLVWPIALDKRVQSPATTIPIFCHGDGVEFVRDSSLMTWSWGSMLSKQSSLSSHLLITAWPKACQTANTWKPIDAWIAWSFEALLSGYHPSVDPYGEALPKGPLADLAGLPLAKGNYRCVIYALQGDAEFYSNTLQLPHWQNRFPCFECDAQRPVWKKLHAPPGKSIKILKEELQDFTPVSPEEALLVKRSHALFSVPGVSSALVRGDSLHILYSRGVGNHLAGSLLHYLCYFDPGKRQSKSPASRLQLLFSKIKGFYSEHKVACRINNLRLSMITDVSAPHKKYPCLDCKAAETKHFLPCLLEVIKQALPEDQAIHKTMVACLEAFVQLINHFDACDLFLTPVEYGVATSLAKRFFGTYQDLHEWALSKGRKLFNITGKFHSCQHMISHTKHLNFRCHQNFRAEDFVGQLSRIGHSVSFGVSSPKLSGKICAKYKCMLHLQIIRPGFSTLDSLPEDP